MKEETRPQLEIQQALQELKKRKKLLENKVNYIVEMLCNIEAV